MQLRPHFIHHFAHILRFAFKIQFIRVDYQEFTIFIIRNPILVALIQLFQIIQTHAALVLAPAQLDVRHQRRDARPQVNQQIRRLYLRRHRLKQLKIVLKIPLRHQAHRVQIRRKNIRILINCAVLHHRRIALQNPQNLLVPIIQKINLQIERPPLHIMIKITQIRIIVCRLIMRLPTKVPTQPLAQRRLPRADIPGNRHIFHRTMRSIFVSQV